MWVYAVVFPLLGLSFYHQLHDVPCKEHKSQYEQLVIFTNLICFLVFLHIFLAELFIKFIFKTKLEELKKCFQEAQESPKEMKSLKKSLENPGKDSIMAKWFITLQLFSILKYASFGVMFCFLANQSLFLSDLEENIVRGNKAIESNGYCAALLPYISWSANLVFVFCVVYFIVLFMLIISSTINSIAKCILGKNKIFGNIFGPPCYIEDLKWINNLPSPSYTILTLASICFKNEDFKDIVHEMAAPEDIQLLGHI